MLCAAASPLFGSNETNQTKPHAITMVIIIGMIKYLYHSNANSTQIMMAAVRWMVSTKPFRQRVALFFYLHPWRRFGASLETPGCGIQALWRGLSMAGWRTASTSLLSFRGMRNGQIFAWPWSSLTLTSILHVYFSLIELDCGKTHLFWILDYIWDSRIIG